ncbi:MAG: hypothetical protein A2Y12_20245 [Planctomycetes bacterium GWF2_42_9]|nr:MAG: hypothetical protein A2Y12_20245 [Planctomycetes bacterium GWF2_42_9]
MNGSARIESIDALRELRTFLCALATKISTAIDEADFEILNTLNQLKLEYLPHWQKELRQREEKLINAKLELKRKQTFEKSVGGHQSFIDEKKALALAQKKFEEAEDKLKKLKALIPRFEKESYECRGILQALSNFIHIDLPNRRTQIDQMIGSLESYVRLEAPIGADVPADADSPNMARSVQLPFSDLKQLCISLRQKNPLRQSSLSVTAGKPSLNLFKNFTISYEILEKLKDAMTNKPGFSENDKLVFDPSIENANSIYIEQTISITHKEIKLYIASTNIANTASNYLICTIAEFLKEYPALKDILFLPEKWLAILENNTVKTIFNANDDLVYNCTG